MLAVDYAALFSKNDVQLLDEIGQLTAETLENDSTCEALGFGGSSARDLGTAIFKRINKELHSLICGGEAPDEDREKLKKILHLDEASMAAALTSVLVLYFSVSVAVAPIVAVLIVKKFIKPAGEEVCAFWSAKLS
ncbi:hypothetical protein [Agrobacterium pusense]|uniref:hypothetical protein n=1 Tax=Agrobacterium pusense TaxID=648995 RepID=UPI0037C0B633